MSAADLMHTRGITQIKLYICQLQVDARYEIRVTVDSRHILGVKLKYVTRGEKAAREVYHREVERWRRTVDKRSQVVKIMNELRRRQNILWEELMKGNEKKVKHLVKKHRTDRIEDRKENDNVSSEEQRILQNIVFSDSLLEEDPEVPVYGDVTLDEDELSSAS